MKTIITGLILFVSVISFSQVSGELKEYKRKITKDIEYTMNHSKQGEVVYDISVDSKGNVTAVTLQKELSTMTSTPALMKAKNAIMKMKFAECTYCPKYHHGYVKIKFVKP